MAMLKEDSLKLGAKNVYELERCWERGPHIGRGPYPTMLFRDETRWPGYYYNADHPKLDDENWKVFVNSRFDPATGQWEMSKKPYIPVCD